MSCNPNPSVDDDDWNYQQPFALTIAEFTDTVLPAVAGLMDAAAKITVGFGVEVFDFCRERYAKVGAAIDVGKDLFATA